LLFYWRARADSCYRVSTQQVHLGQNRCLARPRRQNIIADLSIVKGVVSIALHATIHRW